MPTLKMSKIFSAHFVYPNSHNLKSMHILYRSTHKYLLWKLMEISPLKSRSYIYIYIFMTLGAGKAFLSFSFHPSIGLNPRKAL